MYGANLQRLVEQASRLLPGQIFLLPYNYYFGVINMSLVGRWGRYYYTLLQTHIFQSIRDRYVLGLLEHWHKGPVSLQYFCLYPAVQ